MPVASSPASTQDLDRAQAELRTLHAYRDDSSSLGAQRTSSRLTALLISFAVLGLDLTAAAYVTDRNPLALGAVAATWGLSDWRLRKSRTASARMVFTHAVRWVVERLRYLSVALAHVSYGVLTASDDLSPAIHTRTGLTAALDTSTYRHAGSAVCQFYGHRFEQDDDSFWHQDPTGFQGAVGVS
jgi:hypothetical protein